MPRIVIAVELVAISSRNLVVRVSDLVFQHPCSLSSNCRYSLPFLYPFFYIHHLKLSTSITTQLPPDNLGMADTTMVPAILEYFRVNGGRTFLALAFILLLRVFYSIGKTRLRLYGIRKQGLVCV